MVSVDEGNITDTTVQFLEKQKNYFPGILNIHDSNTENCQMSSLNIVELEQFKVQNDMKQGDILSL